MSGPLPAPPYGRAAPTLSSTLDTTALTAPLDRRAYAALQRSGQSRGDRVINAVLIGILTLIPTIIGVVALVTLITGPTIAGPLTVLILDLAAVGFVVLAANLARRDAIREHRLSQFLAANGLTLLPGYDDPPLPGVLFRAGQDRRALRRARTDLPRFLELGDYQYTVGTKKHRIAATWGYIAVKLENPLPHIVLDARANDLLTSSLPSVFARDQRLSLEGDFDQRFRLFCPKGYERDALYLFTPDVMQRFFDHAASFDVEIVDDWLFFYLIGKKCISYDAAQWVQMHEMVSVVLDKLPQWSRWRDERMDGAVGVAPEGQRLREIVLPSD